ncbi:putative amidoligase enzyme-domain-containing protein [Xylaria arbuscula]|nr:putative amidoligase enzyme-domain-containing protein [Xylaria arbuscula]
MEPSESDHVRANADLFGGFVDSDGILTCGVEFKFLLPSVDCEAEDPDPDVTNQVLYRSDRNDLESVDQQHPDGIPSRLVDDYVDDFWSTTYHGVAHDSWRIGPDRQIDETKTDYNGSEGPYHWTTCELVSPVMSSCHYARQIDNVCQVLKTVRINLNETTSVQVHVGRGDKEFSLKTVQKFATLYWLTEKAIMELHHPDRSKNIHCMPLTQHSVLAGKSLAVLSADPYDRKYTLFNIDAYIPETGLDELRRAQIRRIWKCCFIEQVVDLMRIVEDGEPSRRVSIGFLGFMRWRHPGWFTHTFEWRQMSGSIDPKQINQWIRVCIAFTDFCRLSDATNFKDFASKAVAKGDDYSGIQLLKDLWVDTRIFKSMRKEWAQNR